MSFRLTVTNVDEGVDTADVEIPIVNRAPSANAGADQTVASGARVTLDGSKSSDPDTGDTLTYQWAQVPDVLHTVALSNATAIKPTFTAPTGPAALAFTLTVRDSKGVSAKDTVSVTVLRPTPTPTPTPTPPPPTWEYTGRTDGCGPTFRRERRRGSVTEWVSDPQPDPWGAWSDTGNTMSIGGGVWVKEQTRTSDCGNTETQWVQL